MLVLLLGVGNVILLIGVLLVVALLVLLVEVLLLLLDEVQLVLLVIVLHIGVLLEDIQHDELSPMAAGREQNKLSVGICKVHILKV